MTSNDDYVLEILQEQGRVTQDQIDQAARSLVQEGETVVDVLVQSQVVSADEILEMVAQQFGMEMVSLDVTALNHDLRDLVPEDLARRCGIVPVYRTEDTLTVAMSDPLNFDTLDSLRYALKLQIEGVVAPKEQVEEALQTLYPSESDLDSIIGQMENGDVDVESTGMDDQFSTADATEADAPIIKLVTVLVMEAFRHRASDIHLEPMEKNFRVRYRIDGVLHEVDSPPKRLQPAILSRIKLLANMKISEKRIPQDGRIQVNIKGRELDLRVSSVPTNHGESIVMRILDKQSLVLGLPQLGFLTDDQQTFERLIGLPDGILLVTGPTGSGKTTTLYACLNQINLPDRKIITVEDPVEYQLSGVNQVQVNRDVGLTFAAALRSILRQAPNIVMIGEIRDLETATIATEAALTGHLVFSTLHTNDAPSAVSRLLDIGVKPFLVASALRAAMAQRLVRCICEACKEPHSPTDRQLRLLGPAADELREGTLYHGRGCPKCNLSGYSGRKGIFEIFTMDDSVQRMIFEGAASRDLRHRARELGMRTLREDGLLKVISGMTTVEEVLRVTMGDEA